MNKMTHYYAFRNKEMVVKADGSFLDSQALDDLASRCEITDRFKEDSSGVEVIGLADGVVLPEGYQWTTVRQHLASLDGAECFAMSRGKALLEWRAKSRYCGRCGTKLEDHATLTAHVCPHCGNMEFPRIEPCIIVLVHRGNEILLARHVQRNQQVYACLAGFMEAGETAEQAVEREIMEETGIKVRNINYFGSQSWPFPSQLMIAFTAEYESGELKLQEDEIADAQWFDKEECPATPPPGSIAYQLIHA